MSHVLEPVPLLPAQEELKEIDCGVETVEQVVQTAKEREKNQEPILDEIEHINELS